MSGKWKVLGALAVAAWLASVAPHLSLDGPAGVAAVPEPGSWMLMIVGFGGIGGMLRRRRAPTRA
jgi:hypothetical protein